MKLLFLNRVIISATAAFALIFYSCDTTNGPSVTNTPGNPLKGVYILYEHASGNTDYAYFDAANTTVTDNLFSGSNNGRLLDINAGDMKLNNNRDIYISTLGTQGGAGTVYKINAENNTVTDSVRFGKNPDGFVINNNSFVISNMGSSYVSVLDLNLNIITDSIETGPGPRHITYGFNRYIVTKSGISPENSAALINENGYAVSKLYFPSNPVGSLYNINGIFISTFTTRKIYRIDSESFNIIDSFTVPTSLNNISKLIFKSQQKFFVIAGGREIWEVSTTSGTVSFRNIFPVTDDIYFTDIAYELTGNEIYIADMNNLITNGEMHIIDAENGTVKSTYPLGGRRPVKFAFRY